MSIGWLRVLVIIGGSSGMGRACALRPPRGGARVAIAGASPIEVGPY
jgi:NAD(P)-dependent dehydrogenase (short-subunit alcohol dehydrogenase family)